MPTLSGKQTGELSEALRETFGSVPALEEFLYTTFEKRLADLVGYGANYKTIAFQLIRTADAEGWVLRLVAGACDARPGNATLRGLAAELGLSALPARLDEPGHAGTSLERIILDAVPFTDVSVVLARLGELEAQVCRVEVAAGTRSTAGTGFLVGPDLVLTNYHVISALHNGMGNFADTVLRFDYRRAANGTMVNPGTEIRLAGDWLAAWRPPSEADEQIDPSDRVPDACELDFALLRVQESPGEHPIGRALGVAGSPDRGWVRLDQAGQNGFEVGHPLLIMQHPEDAPLKLAWGRSGGLNTNKTRLRHQVNTRRGSSGSPCLNARLEVVALHHSGDPNFDPSHRPAWNAAIPIAAIRDCLRAENLLSLA